MLKHIVDHYIFGRQKNISSIFLAQSYIEIDQTIRLNSNYMVIYEPKTKRCMKMFLRENYIDENAFKNLKKYDFLFIDKYKDRFFKNFDEEI